MTSPHREYEGAHEHNGQPVLQAVPTRLGARTVLTLAGELDLSTEQILRDAVAACLRRRPETLLLDAAGLRFCDPRGVRALRWALAQAQAAGAQMRIVAADSKLRRLFTLVRADDLLAATAPPGAGDTAALAPPNPIRDPRAFDVTVTEIGRANVVRVRGEVDMASIDQLSSTLLPLVVRSDVVLDTTEVGFCDSCGLHLIVKAHLAARKHGTAFGLTAPSASVARVLELAGALEMLAIFPDTAAALRG